MTDEDKKDITMKTIKREQTKETGKISIRVEGFADERSVRDYVQNAVKPALAQSIAKTVTRDGDAFILETVTCSYFDDDGKVHHATCGPNDLSCQDD
jgi:hypothetical protein